MFDPKDCSHNRARTDKFIGETTEFRVTCPDCGRVWGEDARLLAEREEMLALLREVQWKGQDGDSDTFGNYSGWACCPICEAGEPNHYPDCRLAAFLKAQP